jgi:hypothetical protein
VVNVTDGAMTRKQWALHRVSDEADAGNGSCAA